jgi:hypothetical protein
MAAWWNSEFCRRISLRTGKASGNFMKIAGSARSRESIHVHFQGIAGHFPVPENREMIVPNRESAGPNRESWGRNREIPVSGWMWQPNTKGALA